MSGAPISGACFAPVANADTRLLILGSLPGVQSLMAGRYYANPRNQFWRLIGAVIGQDLDMLDYADRLSALSLAGVGLWDSIANATRPGSLDSAIRDAVPNPLRDFIATLPSLRAVAFNGAKAAAIGLPQLAQADIASLVLPSSSPAHAIPFARKADAWAVLTEFLD